jgi:hypothetical protein
MADKMDTNDPLPILEAIVTNYLAMKYILDHCYTAEPPWRRLLAESRGGVQRQVDDMLREFRDTLQSDKSGAERLNHLAKALDPLLPL